MNDTIIFLVFAGLALVFKWLTSQASKGTEKPEPPPRANNPGTTPVLRQPPQSEEERVRRFLEALGAPPGTKPPPPVTARREETFVPSPAAASPEVTRRRATTPRRDRRGWAQPLPPLATVPEEPSPPPVIAEPVMVEAPLPPLLPAPVFTELPPVRAIAGRAAGPSRTLPATSLGTVLRGRGSMRRAIILREVLGPPRGLQSFEEQRGI